MNTQTTQRVKLMLLSGKRLTKRFLDRVLDVTNSAEIIRRLRDDEKMNIETVWKKSSKGKRYGEYVYKPDKKVNRITSRSYIKH
jgi:hypothetical protein